jgi:NAD(P)-dependent dehydrogenase (short-subunit alcohol dehydrogenase family)
MSTALSDQVAIVTGAGAGIGKAIASRLASEGAHVVIAECDRDSGQAASREIQTAGLRAEFLELDVGETSAVRAAVSQVARRHGRLDILINNAGITRVAGIFDVTEEDWDRIHRVNARGAFFCMQATATQMREQHAGRIVNIASIAGKGFRGTSSIAYAASKGAVIAMTRIAAAQLAPYGVTVNAICPGVTETNLAPGIVPHPDLLRAIPIGRLNKAADIADAALFLVSAGAANITGQSLNVDGGLMWD